MIDGLYHLKKINKKPAQTRKDYQKNSGGFTVVETLIVLAITGVMFVAIVGVVSGRQSKTQFNQAANNITAEIEQVISEVQSGYYPDVGVHECAYGSAESQGKVKECATLGKLVSFKSDKDFYSIDTIIGKRYAQDFQNAEPSVYSAAAQTRLLKFGLTLKWMKAGGADISSFAVVSDFASNSGSGAMYGSQSTNIVPVASGIVNTGILVAAFSNKNPSSGITICFDGGIDKSVLVTVGGANKVNSATFAIKNGDNCNG
jgi:type II secretory pathway pseudopilin PulG